MPLALARGPSSKILPDPPLWHLWRPQDPHLVLESLPAWERSDGGSLTRWESVTSGRSLQLAGEVYSGLWYICLDSWQLMHFSAVEAFLLFSRQQE